MFDDSLLMHCLQTAFTRGAYYAEKLFDATVQAPLPSQVKLIGNPVRCRAYLSRDMQASATIFQLFVPPMPGAARPEHSLNPTKPGQQRTLKSPSAEDTIRSCADSSQ